MKRPARQAFQPEPKAWPTATTSEEIDCQIVEAVARHLAGRHYRLYLFGSRAEGRAAPHSDYDVGLFAEGPVELALLAKIRADLEELPILQKVDLVDLSMASPELVQVVTSKGKLLDER